jgi:hypothetical protein
VITPIAGAPRLRVTRPLTGLKALTLVRTELAQRRRMAKADLRGTP